MKIAIDFDDTMVDTITEFCNIYNEETDPRNKRAVSSNFTGWYISTYLGCSQDYVKEIFNKVDYAMVRPNKDVIVIVQALAKDHEVTILTSNSRYRDIRDWLNAKGMQHIPLVHDIGNKAGWLRENHYDVLVDDRPAALKGAVTVGCKAIRMERPWNKNMESGAKNNTILTFQWGFNGLEETARSWQEVGDIIQEMSGEKLDKSYGIRSALEEVEFQLKVQEVFGDDLDVDTVTNKNGAKQSRIEGRFDLMPPLAYKEIAVVLEKGANKYGDNNWRGLSIDEILNHAFLHLVNYQQEANKEDLSHAACRLMMALDLHLENLDKVEALKI